MRFLLIILLPVFTLLPLITAGQQKYPVHGETLAPPLYQINSVLPYSILNMGYASSEIKDSELWNNKNKKIEEIDIVFTAYPKNKEAWITNYDWLLKKRIESIQKLEPSLVNNPDVKWKFILQTSCPDEVAAQNMFHGAIIKYSLLEPVKNLYLESLGQGESVELETITTSIETLVYGLSSFKDSVVFKTLDRNNWGKMLIVNDWTGSMYPYGAQAVLWHRLNYEKNALKYFIFFNDGNAKTDRQKRIGNTGGIYYCKPDSIHYLLTVMKLVAKRGNGGDIPENNIEALLKGIKLFRGYDELVMIADNKAAVRDMILLEKVSIPVRIVLCGTEENQPIHPHYLEIARTTKGSIHTVEKDIENLGSMKEGEKIILLGIEYIVKKGKLIQKNKKHVPFSPRKVLGSM